MHPLERLVNLVALLLEAPRPLTFEQIRDKMEGYEDSNLASAKRKFERDKDVLRDIGVPIDVVPTDAWEVEDGYVIAKDKYYLPEIDFAPEEISALFVAARSGEDTSTDPAEQAVRKLLAGAAGGILGGASPGPLAAGDDVPGLTLVTAAEAALQQRSVRFEYRTARGEVSERRIDAYSLACRSGHWYLVGLDHERKEIRAFRLSRIRDRMEVLGEGTAPPEGFRARDHLLAGPWGPGEPAGTALIAFSPEVAWWAPAGVPGAEVQGPRADDWIEVLLPAGPGENLSTWLLSFGPDAEVVEPRWLRDEVVARLRDVT